MLEQLGQLGQLGKALKHGDHRVAMKFHNVNDLEWLGNIECVILPTDVDRVSYDQTLSCSGLQYIRIRLLKE